MATVKQTSIARWMSVEFSIGLRLRPLSPSALGIRVATGAGAFDLREVLAERLGDPHGLAQKREMAEGEQPESDRHRLRDLDLDRARRPETGSGEGRDHIDRPQILNGGV
jgi:hypothetical protein